MQHAEEHLADQDPGPERSGLVRTLSVAADSFSASDCSRPAIVAGYPWLGAPLRDWLISLPPLLLVRGHVDEAKRSLAYALTLMHGGLLPSDLPDQTPRRIVRSPDVTLWLFEAARELGEHVRADDAFLMGPLYAALQRAFVRLLGRRRRNRAWVTPEGLLACSLEDGPSSWMDASVRNSAVTPRAGLAVEHQALWYRACRTLAELAERAGDEPIRRAARQAEQSVHRGFRSHFWCNETDYPFDCLSEERGTADAWADPAERPNAVMALALAPELFETWQQDAILSFCRTDLLTRPGLRSLAPTDRNFVGHYEGTLEEREGALHQGTVWPFLLGFYVRAKRRQNPGDEDVRFELLELVQQAITDGMVLGHVGQIADAEEPHRPRGCPAQAWSVAMLLRALVVDLEAT